MAYLYVKGGQIRANKNSRHRASRHLWRSHKKQLVQTLQIKGVQAVREQERIRRYYQLVFVPRGAQVK